MSLSLSLAQAVLAELYSIVGKHPSGTPVHVDVELLQLGNIKFCLQRCCVHLCFFIHFNRQSRDLVQLQAMGVGLLENLDRFCIYYKIIHPGVIPGVNPEMLQQKI